MNKRLELAKAVYPETNWQCVGVVVYQPRAAGEMLFDPENNAEQAFDVLAWLFKQSDANAVLCDKVVIWIHDIERYDAKHDGTAAGIRRAIVQAALRCV